MAIPLAKYLRDMQAQNGRWGTYDPTLASIIGQAQSGLASTNAQYARGVNSTKINYGRQKQRLAKVKDETLGANTNQFADQGILRSGIFATEQGQVGTAYQEDLTDLTADRTSKLTSLSDAKLAEQQRLRGMVSTGVADATRRQEDQRRQAAQEAAEAAHQQKMLELQRQQMEAQKAAAAAQLNAFRGSMGPTGQAFPQPPNFLSGFAGMSPEQLKALQVMNYLQSLKQQKDSRRNPSTNRTAQYR
jgi:hypothetical protein